MFDLYDIILEPQQKAHLYTTMNNNYDALRNAFQSVSYDDCTNGNEYALKLETYDLHKEAEFIRAWSEAYCINYDIVSIMNTLEAKGYDVNLVSCINEYTSCDELINTNPRTPLDILKAEIMGYEPEEESDNQATAVECDTLQEYDNATLQAPSKHEIFGVLSVIAAVCGLVINWRIIYVDSEPENISIAKEYCLETIHLTSAQQLEANLQTLGIL